MRKNFECLRSSFSGAAAPANPVGGQLWYDETNNILKMYKSGSASWLEIYHFGSDYAVWKLSQISAGLFTADATGRGKFANLFITDALVNDVSGGKIATNSIPTAAIQSAAVTGAKLPDGTAWSSGAGGVLVLSADTERGCSGGTYLKKKEIRVLRAGTWRVSFWAGGTYVEPDQFTVDARIYKNGSAYGTERAGVGAAQTFTEDLTFAVGDDVQLYGKGNGSVKWFRLSLMDPIYGSVTTD
jgi:hypothetical protein